LKPKISFKGDTLEKKNEEGGRKMSPFDSKSSGRILTKLADGSLLSYKKTYTPLRFQNYEKSQRIVFEKTLELYRVNHILTPNLNGPERTSLTTAKTNSNNYQTFPKNSHEW